MYKKFGVVGVGAIGGIMAAHLRKEGFDVTLVDIDSAHLDRIQEKGLTIAGLKKLQVSFPKESFCYSIEKLADQDVEVIFVATKASVLPKILVPVKKILKSGMLFISLQNGLETGEFIANTVGIDNTLRLIINYGGSLTAKGQISMSFFNAPNYIGALTPRSEVKAKALAEIISAAGLETAYSSSIKRYEWEKAILNAALNPVCALTQKTMKQMMECEFTRELAKAIVREGIEVAVAIGIRFKEDFFDYCVGYLEKAGHHKTSMRVDLENKSPTEIGFINGKIIELGKAKGVSTPYNSTIVSLIRGTELPSYNQ